MPYFPPPSSGGSFLPLAGGTMTGTITSTIGTVTSSTPFFSGTATWNNGGVAFEAFKINVTSTDSDVTSTLIDLQIGGASKFKVDRRGRMTVGENINVTSGTINFLELYSQQGRIYIHDGGVDIGSATNGIRFASSTNGDGTKDTGLYRIAAGVVEFNNGTPGTLRDWKARSGFLAASTTSQASLRIAHGSAPTSPVDGDMWTTTAGLFVRINGVTVGPLS